MRPVLDIRELGHTYAGAETSALDGVSLQVAPGERVGLLGPNGGGKSTLFRCATALLTPDHGAISVEGHDTRTHPLEARGHLGVVFQTPALDRELSVREALHLQAAFVGLGRSAAEARIGGLADPLGISAFLDQRIGTLSGGQARRADVARGLLHRPTLLLLDEPTVGLDPGARLALWDTLDALRTAETAQLVATHLLDEAERCDRIAILDRGRIVAQGAPQELRSSLGDAALWLDVDPVHADRVRARVREIVGVDAQQVGRRLLVQGRAPARWVEPLSEIAGVRELSVRRPSLGDVFLHATGRPLQTP